MKNIAAFLFFFAFISINAQTAMVPGDVTLETKYIKPEKYQMKWYIVQDAERKHEVARINTEIVPAKTRLNIVTSVDVNNAKTTWIDSTIVLKANLAPVRHYSDNLERAVKLKFGASITGSYLDKLKNQKMTIDDAVAQGQYFDSNFYPYLVRLLPLKEGYTHEIAAYDYSPARKGLVIQKITDVKSGTYKTKGGLKAVWLVTSQETVKGQSSEVKYYIDKADRKIYKQEIFDGAMRTLIERVE